MNSVGFVALGGVAAVAGLVVFGLWAFRTKARDIASLRLAGTMLLAAGALGLVTGWLLAGGTGRGDALKTGGLAAGSVVALYALWLNDRRRRVEEERQDIERERNDLENQRAEHDRERVADERFARAVEMLGNEADQVRMGAVQALAGLARSRPGYTQTVLDVLCAYLRRPFDHPVYQELRGETDPRPDLAAERERQVRLSAQRLIADLLPRADQPDAPRYDLDLTGATLEYFDISERLVGTLVARVANLYESNSVWGCRIHGDAWFTESRSWGRLYAHDITFHRKAWFSGFAADGPVDFARTEFLGPTKFADARFAGDVDLRESSFAREGNFRRAQFERGLDLRVGSGLIADTYGMTVSLTHEVALPDGWEVDPRGSDTVGLVRA